MSVRAGIMRVMANPSVGPASILGWATFAVAELTTVVTAATASEAQLAGPGKWTAILGIVALAVTNAGRYLQAHKMASPAVTQDLEGAGALLPTIAQELAQPPSALSTPPVVVRPASATVPDGAIAADPPGV